MKKILIGVMGLMFIATPIYAQTVEQTVPTRMTHDQIVIALQQAFELLTKLVAQLQQISDNQATIATQLGQIAQNNTPIPIEPVFGSVSDISVISAPTCTLTASTTDYYSFVGSFGWTSTNATKGTILFHSKNGNWYTVANLIPTNSGYLDGIGFMNIPDFEARFSGAGGETVCKTTLIINQ